MKTHIYTSLLLSCSAMQLLHAQPQHTDRPNLLIVMADQFRASAFGFKQIEPVQTPNLDRFAKESVVVSQAVSGYPVSSPTRGMLYSGAYPHVNGILSNCNSNTAPHNVELRQDLVCWSDVLHDEGYITAHIGKWHMDKPVKPYVECYNNKGTAWNEWCPPERRHGFDYWISYGTYDRHLNPMYWNTDSKREEFYYVNQWGPEYETDVAIHFLDSIRGQENPFAVMVSMNPPHTGYEQVPDKYKQMYEHLNVDSIADALPCVKGSSEKSQRYFKRSLANYYACITGVDEQFGRIMKALEKNGQLENTIVIFLSDHGDSMGMHDNIGKNIFYEEAMRVPFFVSWKKKLKPRLDEKLLYSMEDFCPTILSLMGYKDKIPETVQTRDLSEFIKGAKRNLPKTQLYMLYSGITKDQCDLTTGARGLRDKRYTYAVRYKKGIIYEEFLFDRKKDHFQMNNLAQQRPAKANKMFQEMIRQLTLNGDPAAIIHK